MKVFFCFIIIVIISCQTKSTNKLSNISISQSAKKIEQIDNYLFDFIGKYGKVNVLIGLYFISRSSLDPISAKIDSLNGLYCTIDAYLDEYTKSNDSLIYVVQKNLRKESEINRNKIIHKLTIWLKDDILLSAISDGNLSENLFFLEIIDKIPETKSLITKYIKDPRQYWGSLDENQSCEIYYDLQRYLLKLSDLERIKFFRKYFDTSCYLSIKSR